MITFLWMLYLATTLLVTINQIGNTINLFNGDLTAYRNKNAILFGEIITCILWSVWFHYYLN